MSTQLTEDKKNAMRLIECFEGKKMDYSMILYLQLPQSQIDSHPILKPIQDICMDFGVTVMRHHFFKTVGNYIYSSGIREITPMSFVNARGKDDLLKEYKKKKSSWGLHIPFCFQVCGPDFAGSVFFITRTWQDGLHRLLQILKDTNVSYKTNTYNACSAVEQVIEESSLSSALFDCEVLATQYEGRASIQQIKNCVLNFPAIMSGLFMEAGVINVESILEFVVKDKCRHVGHDLKISYHFRSSVVGTKTLHAEAMKRVLAPHGKWMEHVKNCIKNCPKNKNKTLTLIPDGKLCNPEDPQSVLIFLDPKALPGGPNGFTTAFSCKKTGDDFPVMIHSDTACIGKIIDRDFCNYPAPHNLDGIHLTDKDRLEILWQSCYTTPKLNMTSYSEEFIQDLQDAKKVLSRI
jgi:hypothetical protein